MKYGHTNLLVAALLLTEAAGLLEAGSADATALKVCDLLVAKAKEQLG